MELTSMPGGLVRCGTAGWSYAHWNGAVYPKAKPRGFHALQFMAEYFDAVEINATFYQPLRPEVARLWLKKTEHNPRFVFTAKLNRRFTHDRVLDAAEIARFKEGLWPLARANRLGCVLMQFPWTFRFTAENREWFIQLRRAFREFPLAAEMRHASWMSEEALGVFIDHRVAFCNIDQPVYTKAMPPSAFLTSRIAYVRLHGRNPANSLGNFNSGAERAAQHDYLYKAEELAEWSVRIRKLARSAELVFVMTNNDAGGKSFVNALQLQKMFDAGRAAAPEQLLALYGDVLDGFTGAMKGQHALFGPAESGVGPRRAA
jgi:uncharacterized protein YecE (DUF72 family)